MSPISNATTSVRSSTTTTNTSATA
jgi:hypothetical protein